MLDVAAYHERVEVIVLPPLCPLAVSSTDFRHADDLMTRAWRASHRWLDEGGAHRAHPERFLSLHTHKDRRVPVDRHGGHAA